MITPDRQTDGHGDINDPERCCLCGGETREGLYVRMDPATVPFPSIEEKP